METPHDTADPRVPNADPSESVPAFPSLPVRAMQVFFSPGTLMDRLAADPRWVSMFLLGTGLTVVASALIPPELMLEMIRQQMLEAGGNVPEMNSDAVGLIRAFSIGGAALSMIVLTFVFAAFYSIVFAFILGDEGTFKQYLAALAHAWFIPAFLGLLLVPLWISTGNLELRPSVASFFFFLPDGLLLNALTVLDLTHIWATLVFAQGAHAIDSRRSFGSAAAIGLTVLVVVAFGLGWAQSLGPGG